VYVNIPKLNKVFLNLNLNLSGNANSMAVIVKTTISLDQSSSFVSIDYVIRFTVSSNRRLNENI
jgi:hypothetical protein